MGVDHCFPASFVVDAGIDNLAPHDLRRSCARLCHGCGGELEQIQFLLGHASVQTTERYIGCKQKLKKAVNDRFGISVASDAAYEVWELAIARDVGNSVLYRNLFNRWPETRFEDIGAQAALRNTTLPPSRRRAHIGESLSGGITSRCLSPRTDAKGSPEHLRHDWLRLGLLP